MSTPDTEWEKEFDKRFGDTFRLCCDDETLSPVIKGHIRNLLTSRDTYWKERVKQVSYEIVKEFQDSLITIAIKNEHMRGCVTSNQIIQAFKDFEASTHPILDITNEDNLK